MTLDPNALEAAKAALEHAHLRPKPAMTRPPILTPRELAIIEAEADARAKAEQELRDRKSRARWLAFDRFLGIFIKPIG